MDLDELKQSWIEHASKLDQILKLNLQSVKRTQVDGTRSALNRFKVFRLFEILAGIPLIIWLGSYIADHISTPTLAISAFIFAAFVLAAVIGNIRQVVLLQDINLADPVTIIQRKLQEIRLQFLLTIRLGVLLLPFYMVFIVLGFDLIFGLDLLAHASALFLWTNLAVSLLLLAPAIWIFRNLSPGCSRNPVIHSLVQGAGGKQIIAALEFLDALREFEKEDPGV